MPTVIRRDNIDFRDQTVYMAGHAYVNCTFDHCTIVVREATGVLENCKFTNCVWHLDAFFTDRDRLTHLVNSLIPLMAESLPNASGAATAVLRKS